MASGLDGCGQVDAASRLIASTHTALPKEGQEKEWTGTLGICVQMKDKRHEHIQEER